MDCLIGIVKTHPKDKNTFVAHSLECNISADGNTKEESAKKLANLLNAHLKGCSERHTNPNVYNEKTIEKMMKYAEKNGFPNKLPDEDIGYGVRLRCYDLTEVAAKV